MTPRYISICVCFSISIIIIYSKVVITDFYNFTFKIFFLATFHLPQYFYYIT